MPCRFINISNDLKAITKLIQKELGYGSMNEEDVLIQLKAMEKSDQYQSIVFEKDGEVLGFAELAYLYAYETKGQYARLIALAVREDKQHTGIGGSLLAYAQTCAKAHAASDIAISSGLCRRKESDEKKKLSYMKEVLHILGNSKDEETMPWLSNQIDALYAKTFPHAVLPYATIKKHYNEMMCAMEADIRKQIQCKEDALAYAIQLARVGNYIDFGALDEVDANFFLDLLAKADEDVLDSQKYAALKQDLANARRLLYICDNCGEILLDKLLIEQLQFQYPHLSITAMVRGGEVINDATMIDAQDVHLQSICHVIDNGIAMAGTDIRHISQQAFQAIQDADIILAKGQANFETLCGNGLPVYYLLLCKCDLFAERFSLPKYKGVLFHEDSPSSSQ